MNDVIEADWPAPTHIKAMTTLRHPGCSKPPYDSWNLALHVKDRDEHVLRNRARLEERLGLPASPTWLEQVHGVRILDLDNDQQCRDRRADGSYTQTRRKVCAVMTADCLPLLICNRQGSEVAAVHAGWRGLAAGVLETALRCFRSPEADLLVWLGPAIGPQAFEVGDDVVQAFVQHDPDAQQAFTPCAGDKYLADIYQLARQRLSLQGIRAVYGGDHCTYSDSSRFYSYRRDSDTGRMASLIWLQE